MPKNVRVSIPNTRSGLTLSSHRVLTGFRIAHLRTRASFWSTRRTHNLPTAVEICSGDRGHNEALDHSLDRSSDGYSLLYSYCVSVLPRGVGPHFLQSSNHFCSICPYRVHAI